MQELLALGVFLSVLVFELTGFVPGGIIVPGYMAMYILQPAIIISTFIVSLLTLLLVNQLSSHAIIYGRRKFAAYVLIGIILKYGLTRIPLIMGFFVVGDVLGYVIPGLMAREMENQGILVTWGLTLLTSALVRIIYDLVLIYV